MLCSGPELQVERNAGDRMPTVVHTTIYLKRPEATGSSFVRLLYSYTRLVHFVSLKQRNF